MSDDDTEGVQRDIKSDVGADDGNDGSIEGVLSPLLHDAPVWFSRFNYVYETVLQRHGEIDSLGAEAVIFKSEIKSEDSRLVERWQLSDYVDPEQTIKIVSDESEARSQCSKCIWIDDGEQGFVYEYIPFEWVISVDVNRVSDWEEFVSVMGEILDSSPDYERMRAKLSEYVEQKGGSQIDDVAETDFETAIETLSSSKKQFSDLPESDQQKLANAISTIQNTQLAN